MKRKKLCALALALLLLAGCAPAPPEPTAPPTPTPAPLPTRLTWLHGFYAGSSYSQIGLAAGMDAVSLGWGQMYVDEAGEPYLNTRYKEGNTWVIPKSPQLATDYFEELAIPYHLCVYATAARPWGETNVLEYLLTPAVRDRAAEVLVEAAAPYSGLTLDFECLAGAAARGPFAEFVALVRQKLPPDKGLYVTVHPDLWYQGYDYRALGEICDKVILMAHDYQWTTAPEDNLGTALTDTPVAPIGQVEWALQRITDPETGVRDVDKVALAIAFATAGVEVDEEGLLIDRQVYHPAPDTLAARLAQSDAQPGWSEEYASPYVYYHNEEGRRFLVWYEDARSVEAKIQLCYRYGVTGLSLWRLGTVPDFDHYSVWPTVDRHRGK